MRQTLRFFKCGKIPKFYSNYDKPSVKIVNDMSLCLVNNLGSYELQCM